ncbi:hypothetical protein GCM10023085_37800 [Actinomadura viridis]|uniref:Uncharacterized protein n=1 Tax=Actinomadura viridis TaxID=58110 RepID=A0A931DCK9_9ACTN|nr:hypothetical protein [Actinomadura viridis]MBG6087685.1 hypothetical protein [Actinomadura viridis]
MLACAAALSTVLDVHRPATAPAGPNACHGCGTLECRPLTAVLHVLDAYAAHPAAVDRAEAWRRADRYFNSGSDPTLLVFIEDIGEGFAARAFAFSTERTEPVLVIDHRTGHLTRWPLMPRATLIEEYRRHLTILRGSSATPSAGSAREQ